MQVPPETQSAEVAQPLGHVAASPLQRLAPHVPLVPFAAVVQVPGVALHTSQAPAQALSQQ